MENEKLETVVARHDEQIKQNCKDITKLQDQGDAIYKLATSVELLAQNSAITNDRLDGLDIKIDKVDDKVNKLDKDLNKVKNRDLVEIKNNNDKEDAKKWRGAIKYITTAILGAVVALVLKQIGLI